jgi:hypothetical protein
MAKDESEARSVPVKDARGIWRVGIMTRDQFDAKFVWCEIIGPTLVMPRVCCHCGQPIVGEVRPQDVTGSSTTSVPGGMNILSQRWSFPSCADCYQGLFRRGPKTVEGFRAPRIGMRGTHVVTGLHRSFAVALREANPAGAGSSVSILGRNGLPEK